MNEEVAEGEVSDPHDFTPQQQDEQQPEARRAPVEAARLLEASQPERLLLYNGQC